jgi:hypothetical protein
MTTKGNSQGSTPLYILDTNQAGRQYKYMKWTYKINIFIMQEYYRITNKEIKKLTLWHIEISCRLKNLNRTLKKSLIMNKSFETCSA